MMKSVYVETLLYVQEQVYIYSTMFDIINDVYKARVYILYCNFIVDNCHIPAGRGMEKLLHTNHLHMKADTIV
jgi:hypothetical protein